MRDKVPSKVFSAAVLNLAAQPVEVETDVASGLRCFTIVGLGDKAVQESRKRIGAALKSAGFTSPYSKPQRVLVNLAPADLKKEGTLYDLPIAVGYLLSSDQIPSFPEKRLLVGELALDSGLRPIKGALSFSLLAKKKGFSELILPRENAKEAALVKGVRVIGVNNLKEVTTHLKEANLSPTRVTEEVLKKGEKKKGEVDIGWIKGQSFAKRALAIAAAGGHHVMMTGPPGTGKTLLARSICSILPRLSFQERLEVTKIYSLAGLLGEKPLVKRPPFRAPHHTSSEPALIGGGNPPEPGEITLAHRGVLFLDEFPEFHRDVLESLRQPLEENHVTVLRAGHRAVFPARFTMVCAANPCPCGYRGNPEKKCTCTTRQIQKYRRKLRGPLMDRLDIFIEVPKLKYEKLVKKSKKGEAEKIRGKVEQARKRAEKRFEKEKISLNSEMGLEQIKKYCSVPEKAALLLKKYVNGGKLSARGYHRVLKLSRTIADLEGKEKINTPHVSEAIMYRLREDEG